MRDPQFRQQQVDGLRAPHVAPVNALVDELINSSGRGSSLTDTPTQDPARILVTGLILVSRVPAPRAGEDQWRFIENELLAPDYGKYSPPRSGG